MEVKSVLVIFILLAGCATHQLRLERDAWWRTDVPMKKATGEASIMQRRALESYREEYKDASLHKAFAQSDSGHWAWKSNRTSREHAITNALIACQANNGRYEFRYPCKIINVDDKWVGSAAIE